MQVDSLKNFSKQSNGKLFFDYDLKKTNWFNIGGKAKEIGRASCRERV